MSRGWTSGGWMREWDVGNGFISIVYPHWQWCHPSNMISIDIPSCVGRNWCCQSRQVNIIMCCTVDTIDGNNHRVLHILQWLYSNFDFFTENSCTLAQFYHRPFFNQWRQLPEPYRRRPSHTVADEPHRRLTPHAVRKHDWQEKQVNLSVDWHHIHCGDRIGNTSLRTYIHATGSTGRAWARLTTQAR